MLEVLIQPKTDIPKNAVVELRLPLGGEVSFTAAALAKAPVCEMLGLSIPEIVPC